MDGHEWHEAAESEVTMSGTGLFRRKKQKLWHCPRCHTSTIVDDGLDPESTRDLYHIEPLELDGTTIMDPPIASCDEEVIGKVMRS